MTDALIVCLQRNGLPAVAKDKESDKLDRNGRNRIEKTLHLKKGRNALEITCVHHDWQRRFSLDLEPLAGGDLGELRYA